VYNKSVINPGTGGGGGGGTFTITTTTLPDGSAGSIGTYFAAIQATGGTDPCTWTISAGSLPAGYKLSPIKDANTGLVQSSEVDITGFAGAAAGVYTFTVQGTDADGKVASKQFTITVK
jgi:hypothetical protein